VRPGTRRRASKPLKNAHAFHLIAEVHSGHCPCAWPYLTCHYATSNVLPYLFGGIVSLGLLLIAGVKIVLALWVWLLALLWASAVLLVKMKFRTLGEEIEHYRAAHATLLCGLPYLRKRNELRDAAAGTCEI